MPSFVSLRRFSSNALFFRNCLVTIALTALRSAIGTFFNCRSMADGARNFSSACVISIAASTSFADITKGYVFGSFKCNRHDCDIPYRTLVTAPSDVLVFVLVTTFRTNGHRLRFEQPLHAVASLMPKWALSNLDARMILDGDDSSLEADEPLDKI